MAVNYISSERQAKTFLDQAEKQLSTAQRLNGDLSAAVAVTNVQRSENLYGQVNTFLGLARTNARSAGTEISDMARQATTEPQRETVQVFTAIQKNIISGIESIGASSRRLIDKLRADTYDQQKNEATPAANSAGEEVAAAAAAAVEDSRTQNPPTPGEYLDENEEVVEVNPNAGTETNAKETPVGGDNEDLGNVDGGTVVSVPANTRSVRQTQDGGVSAPNDDSRQFNPDVDPTGSQGGGRPEILPEFLAPIIPQTNLLSKLASMTYSFSIYILDIDEYKQILMSQKKTLPSTGLIVQSGGFDRRATGATDSSAFFDVDYYIDDVNITSSIGTAGGTRAHNALDLQMTIVEPNGISFIPRLRAAVQQHIKQKNLTISEANQNFLLVVRFYGYDNQGNLISGPTLDQLYKQEGRTRETTSDNNAITEKWIPFQIANVQYKIATKNVEYRIVATVPQVTIALSTKNATIPFDFELKGGFVKTILNGPPTSSTVATETAANVTGDSTTAGDPGSPAAPPTADLSADIKRYTSGLAQALNEHQQWLKSKNKISVPDQYVIELAPVKGLIDAKISPPGKNQEKSRAATPPVENARDALLMRTGSYDKDTKNWSITRGTQIVQVIDLAIRNSSFITQQQNVIIDPVTKRPTVQKPGETAMWYRIKTRVEPIGYDNIRRDIAYRITYTVAPYQINDPRVPAFPDAAYRGAHKIYNYWFTGQNSEVIDLDLVIDYNYITGFTNFETQNDEYTTSGRVYEKRAFINKPNAEGTGGTGDTNTAAAQLAERLYSDQDIQKATLTIMGDPDWIQQSEVFYNRGNYYKPFMPDGTVNYDASEVLYEIRFNPVTDYNLVDGLAAVNANNLAYGQASGQLNLPQQSTVFAAMVVKSMFRQGRFTQRLQGNIKYFNPTKASVSQMELARQQAAIAVSQKPTASTGTRTPDNPIASSRNTNDNGAIQDSSTFSDPAGTGDAAAIINAAAGGQQATAPSDDQ